MVNDDLAEMSKEEIIDIDQLVLDYQHIKSGDVALFNQIAEKIQLIIETKEGMRLLLSAQDALELSELLLNIGLVEDNTGEKRRNRYIDVAYLLCYRYFESHDMLERYFASQNIVHILQRAGDSFAETYKDMAEWASKDPLYLSTIEAIDLYEDKHVLFGQILLAFAPYIMAMQKIYPTLVDETLVEMSQQIVDNFPGTDEDRQMLLPKMDLLADFIEKDWEMRIKN